MITSTENKIYKSMMKKGNGSILQSIRSGVGAGKGMIAGGIILLVITLPITVIGLIADAGAVTSILLSVPGVLLIAFGIPMKRKRASSWISYYQEHTGFSEGELLQLDRELASPSVTLVVCRTPNAAVDNHIACFFTENYMVVNGMEPYVRRLEDIIAVAFSDSTDIWCMSVLSKSDKAAERIGLFTETQRKTTLCNEIMQELCRRNPDVLRGQEITCDGKMYILERDGAEILRLYQEGRTLEEKDR
ncbi:MAG: hypothetical protein NC123_00195 [Butyrivibrio sp.]|nr:hypothetical protein [Acetatifactor muris]MCM1557954.1 hypothetical protein [Butyrivibrio sp.]